MRRLASDLRVRSQSYNLFVLTRKCDSYIYVHQRLLRSMQRPPQGPSEQRKGIFQGFEHPNIQKSSFNDEMERSELELDQTTYSEDFSVSHFVGNRGRGKCGAIPHNANPANAGESPSSSSTNITLHTSMDLSSNQPGLLDVWLYRGRLLW